VKKGDDKGVKVWGLIVILAVVVAVFSGVMSAENVPEIFRGSVVEAEIQTAVSNLSSAELAKSNSALDDDPLHQLLSAG